MSQRKTQELVDLIEDHLTTTDLFGDARRALTELAERLEAAELKERSLVDYFEDASQRAEAAESQIAELVEALERIADGCSKWPLDWTASLVEKRARELVAKVKETAQ